MVDGGAEMQAWSSSLLLGTRGHGEGGSRLALLWEGRGRAQEGRGGLEERVFLADGRRKNELAAVAGARRRGSCAAVVGGRRQAGQGRGGAAGGSGQPEQEEEEGEEEEEEERKKNQFGIFWKYSLLRVRDTGSARLDEFSAGRKRIQGPVLTLYGAEI